MRAIIVAAAVVAAHSSVLALDAPVLWRDPDSGCTYWLTPQGGIAARFRRDGVPDCPDVQATGLPLISDQSLRDAARELGRGLDALKGEVDRLGERLRR